jgi:pyruvyltransferase
MSLLKSFIRRFYRVADDSPMIRLKYFQKFPNVGDVFSRVVAEHYFSKNIIPLRPAPVSETNLILLGSILHWADSQSVVCGAGFMFSDAQLAVPPKTIVCLRGPLTAALLQKQGITPPNRFADPGVLAPLLYQKQFKVKHKIGIIPHYRDSGSVWIKRCKNQGFPIIDVFATPEKFFRKIQQCEVILSSSLHGLIFAHAYGKPAVWIELSDKVAGNGFKFFDYYQSVGIHPEKVNRVRINDSSDPIEISKTATFADHKLLIETMEESIYLTKKILLPDS